MQIEGMKLLTLPLALLATGCFYSPIVQPRPAPRVESVAVRNAKVNDFVSLVNRHRQRAGCPVLVWDARIATVAQMHSNDMLNNNFYSHKNPRGQSPFDRLGAAGIGFARAAENIAHGQTTARQALSVWIGSSKHRMNIEECRYTRHGVGLAGTYWTHMFTGDR